MRSIANCVKRITENMMCNVARQQSLEPVHTHTHTHTSDFIEGIRVVNNCSVCSGRNRLLLDRLRDLLGKSLFCVFRRRILCSI